MKTAKLLTIVTCCLAATVLLFFVFTEEKQSNPSSKLLTVDKRAKRLSEDKKGAISYVIQCMLQFFNFIAQAFINVFFSYHLLIEFFKTLLLAL